ncbi:HNH endonuclease [Halosimplex rubrum]|uniref:HNH endonuclease n=1 Tax=Halosimplex rubrum TaxID=869889 RepID=A0A7D5TPN9_9EURY|nr:HNH endonuclease [Halosimplex rubrum]QLH78274.1 HNH endonuclease [Halosimplex rubrum]
MGKKLYSNDELLNRLRKFAEKLGRPPSQSEMDDSGPHASKTYGNRFGSWNNALQAAGLQTGTNDPNGRPVTPEEDLLTDLKSVADIVGGTPSEREYSTHGEYSVKTYCKRFGGWNSALRAAGFEPNVEMNLSQGKLLTALQGFAEKLGRPPTTDEMDRSGPYTSNSYKRAFGTWNRALRQAGLEVHSVWDVSEEDLISELNSLAEELGHVPRKDEMRNQGKWSAAVYQERFGSWNEALRAAGFEPNQRWRIPREELLAELRAVADDLGHPPTTTEINEHGKFTIDPYQREFGTWRTALQAADPDYLENYRQSDTETVPFGSNWPQIREVIITRDNESCLRCGMDREGHREKFGRDLPVHHRIPRRRFYDDPDQSVDDADVPSNLLTLCIPCHRRLERLPVQPVVD